jgi:hypothetical protein
LQGSGAHFQAHGRTLEVELSQFEDRYQQVFDLASEAFVSEFPQALGSEKSSRVRRCRPDARV